MSYPQKFFEGMADFEEKNRDLIECPYCRHQHALTNLEDYEENRKLLCVNCKDIFYILKFAGNIITSDEEFMFY